MMKVKQTILGCFRSFDGGRFLERICSFIVMAHKQNVKVFKALWGLFMDNSIVFQLFSKQAY